MRDSKRVLVFFVLVFSLLFFAQGWASNDWTINDSRFPQLILGEPDGYVIGKFLVDLPEDRSDFYKSPKGEKLPAHFDWRNNGGDWTTFAKNQGYCGSCAAFSAVGAFEAVINIANGDPNLDLNLSEQHLFSCGGGSCNYGMYINDAMDYLRSYGIPSENCFPYTSGNDGVTRPCSSTCPDWQSQAKRINNWWWVNGDVSSMKSAIYNYGPIVTAFLACDDLYYYDAGEIYTHSGSCYDCTAHGVTIVGWDDSQQYWIVKNSWGTSWGDSGFFKIRWGTCGIDSSGSSFGIAMSYTPTDDDGDDDDDDDDDVCDDVCYKFRYCDLISEDVSDATCLDWCRSDMTSEEQDCVHGADTCKEVKDCMGVDDDDDDGSDNPSLFDLLECSFASHDGMAGGLGLLILIAIGLGFWLRRR